ncbi:MAG: hypothetical protein WBA93_33795 [Microcoleaceae cyanobacterium]
MINKYSLSWLILASYCIFSNNKLQNVNYIINQTFSPIDVNRDSNLRELSINNIESINRFNILSYNYSYSITPLSES